MCKPNLHEKNSKKENYFFEKKKLNQLNFIFQCECHFLYLNWWIERGIFLFILLPPCFFVAFPIFRDLILIEKMEISHFAECAQMHFKLMPLLISSNINWFVQFSHFCREWMRNAVSICYYHYSPAPLVML